MSALVVAVAALLVGIIFVPVAGQEVLVVVVVVVAVFQHLQVGIYYCLKLNHVRNAVKILP